MANSSAPYRIDGSVCLNGRTRNSGCTQTGGITMTLVHKDSSGNQIGDEVTTATLDDENNLGWYQFTGLAANDSQAGDYYTVIPYKLGFGFTPSQEDVVITDSNIPGLDFEGTELTYTISGIVSSNSVPLEGVVVSLHTLLNGVTNTLTNGDGEYMFGNLYNGFYALTTDGEGCYPLYGSMRVRIHYESEEVNLECEGGGLESALAEKQSVMSRLNALRAVDRRTKEADNGDMETQAVKSNPSAVRSKASAQSSSRTESVTATYYFYHWDHLGTTRLITSSTGAVVSRHDYEPFGVEIPTINDTASNTHQFTGHERDKTTGYDYMHFRYYGSNIGRFMKPDNVTGSPLNPQNWNLYSYVRGNPVNMNDPTGHTPLTVLAPPGGSVWDAAMFYMGLGSGTSDGDNADDPPPKGAETATKPGDSDFVGPVMPTNPSQETLNTPQEKKTNQNIDMQQMFIAGGTGRQGGHGKGERGKTGKPDKPGRHVKPDPDRPGEWLFRDPQTKNWRPKQPGWKPPGWKPKTTTEYVVVGTVIGLTALAIYAEFGGLILLPVLVP